MGLKSLRDFVLSLCVCVCMGGGGGEGVRWVCG